MVLPSSYLKIPGILLRLNNVDANKMESRLEKKYRENSKKKKKNINLYYLDVLNSLYSSSTPNNFREPFFFVFNGTYTWGLVNDFIGFYNWKQLFDCKFLEKEKPKL